MVALDEQSEDHQSNYGSSWGEHERLNHISSQSIQQLLRHFTKNTNVNFMVAQVKVIIKNEWDSSSGHHRYLH